jgi:ribosomal protein S26
LSDFRVFTAGGLTSICCLLAVLFSSERGETDTDSSVHLQCSICCSYINILHIGKKHSDTGQATTLVCINCCVSMSHSTNHVLRINILLMYTQSGVLRDLSCRSREFVYELSLVKSVVYCSIHICIFWTA